jgi:hypothetical protein
MRTDLLLVLAACVLVACPGTLDPNQFGAQLGTSGGAPVADAGNVAPLTDASSPSACPDVPTAVFGQVCGGACHAGATQQSNLDLASPNVAQRLLGKSAIGGGGLLLDPTNPEASVVYTKMTSTPPFGARMPSAPAQPLDDATTACVLTWVKTAAQPGTPLDDGGSDAEADAPVLQGNLVRDPGFEMQTAKDLAAPWVPVTSGSPYATGNDLDPKLAHAGSNDAFIYAPNAPSSSFSAVTQDVTVSPKTNYHLSGWVKSSANFGNGGTIGAKAGSTVLQESSFAGNSSSYTQVSVDFNSGPNGTITIYVGYSNGPGTTSYIQVDDMSLVGQ